MEYKYTATNKITGNRISGIATAPSVSELVMKLKTEDLLPLKVHEHKAKLRQTRTLKNTFSKVVTGKELAIFTRQLAATLSAGLLLTEALETISDDLDNVRFQKIVRRLKEEIQAGSDFSTALARFPHVFPITYVSIIKSGEATGNLHITTTNLAQYLENSERIKEKVKNAVRYPLFVIGFALLVVAVIVLFLIPKFQGMFASAGSELPLLTRIVVGVSEFCLKYSPFMALGLFGLWLAFMYCLRFKGFKRKVDIAKLKIPIIGKEIIHKALISRFCRTLGFLFEGGVGLAKSLEITGQVVDHQLMQEATQQIQTRVVSGSSIAAEIKKQEIFPSLVSKMSSVGERTGKISEMLIRTSDYYDDELDSSLQNLTTMLEPALIIFIGGIVLIVVLALYLPIFQMSLAVH